MEIVVAAILTVAGLAMLCFGGSWLVSGGVGIAKKLGVSPMVIGMTVIAYGTSTPELAASIAAASDHGEIILGNVIGSNIANIGLVIGIAAMMVALSARHTQLKKDIPIMIGVSVLLLVLSIDGEISRYDGIILLGSLIVFTIHTYKSAKKHAVPADDDVSAVQQKSIYLKSGSLIGIGVATLGIGAWLTIDNAVILAASFGLSEKIIGLTVIAVGTSLPELVTSVIAIRKGQTDIGIGNIIGSHVYNILMIMGLASIVSHIAVESDVFIDYAVMIGFNLVLLVALKTKVINRPMGIGLMAAYTGYITATFFMP